jgi:hypothetical protein
MDAGGPRFPKEARRGREGSGRQVVRSFRVRSERRRRDRGNVRRIVRGKGEYSGPTEGFGYPIRRLLHWAVRGLHLGVVRPLLLLAVDHRSKGS